MEENNFGYGFEHDDYGRFEQDIDQDTAYVIRPEQMGGGASPQPQIKRTIPIVTIALIVANVIAGIMCIGQLLQNRWTQLSVREAEWRVWTTYIGDVPAFWL